MKQLLGITLFVLRIPQWGRWGNRMDVSLLRPAAQEGSAQLHPTQSDTR